MSSTSNPPTSIPLPRGPLRAMLWSKRRIAWNTLKSVSRESKLKVIVVSVSAVFLWLFFFLLAYAGLFIFRGIGAEVVGVGSLTVGDLVMARLFSVMALTLFAMLLFSNVLVTYATLYRSREVGYLLERPMSITTLFLGRFSETISFSSWATAFLASPVLLAYGISVHAPLIFYISLIFFYIPFVAIPAAIGAMISILLVRIFSHLRRGPLVAFAILCALIIGGLVRQTIQAPEFAEGVTVQGVVDTMGRTQSPFLPSHWVADGMIKTATGEFDTAAFHLLLLVVNAAFFVFLTTVVAEKWYYGGYSQLLAGDLERGVRTAGGGVLGRLDGWLRFLPQPHRSMVVKDLRTFWRDPAQWSQFLIFFGIMTIYVAKLGDAHPFAGRASWSQWATLLNLIASMLILASLTSRFIYPLVSLEGPRFWLLGLAPLPRRTIVWQKFWLSFSLTAGFTIGLGILSAVRLDLDRDAFILSVSAIAATTFALTGLAIGLGSLYPNFSEDNPSRIVSGLGGTLNFIFSMMYIVAIAVTVGVFLFSDRGENAGFPWIFAVIIVVMTATAWLVPMRLGVRHLERLEL